LIQTHFTTKAQRTQRKYKKQRQFSLCISLVFFVPLW
jgi:hypothetical protein